MSTLTIRTPHLTLAAGHAAPAGSRPGPSGAPLNGGGTDKLPPDLLRAEALPPALAAAPSAQPQVQPASPAARQQYLALLGWAFTLFNTLRVFTYLPTMWAIHTSGDSSQHAVLTWLMWTGANITMALWLYENAGQRLNRAALVNIGNAGMCLATTALILWHRL